MKDFTDLLTTRKGSIGELFALRFFHARNVPLYPTWGDGSHPADFIMQGRESLAYVEVKTYPRRYVAAQTGIDQVDGRKVYFSLRRMHMIKKLTAKDLEQLPEIDDAHRYRNVKPYFWLESNRIQQPIKRGIRQIRPPKKARAGL